MCAGIKMFCVSYQCRLGKHRLELKGTRPVIDNKLLKTLLWCVDSILVFL